VPPLHGCSHISIHPAAVYPEPAKGRVEGGDENGEQWFRAPQAPAPARSWLTRAPNHLPPPHAGLLCPLPSLVSGQRWALLWSHCWSVTLEERWNE